MVVVVVVVARMVVAVVSDVGNGGVDAGDGSVGVCVEWFGVGAGWWCWMLCFWVVAMFVVGFVVVVLVLWCWCWYCSVDAVLTQCWHVFRW